MCVCVLSESNVRSTKREIRNFPSRSFFDSLLLSFACVLKGEIYIISRKLRTVIRIYIYIYFISILELREWNRIIIFKFSLEIRKFVSTDYQNLYLFIRKFGLIFFFFFDSFKRKLINHPRIYLDVSKFKEIVFGRILSFSWVDFLTRTPATWIMVNAGYRV